MAEESLIDRIKDAAERSCVISVLSDVSKVVSSQKTRQGFRRSVLETLLQQIKPSFLGMLTETEFNSYYVKIFCDYPLEDALMAIVQCIRSPIDAYKLQHTIVLFDAVEKNGLKKHVMESITFSADDDLLSALCFELSRLVLQIPDLLYNASGRSVKVEVLTNRYESFQESSYAKVQLFLNTHYYYLLDAIECTLEDAKQRVERKVDVNLRFVAALLPALFRGDIKTFHQLIVWLENRDSSPVWERLSSRLFTDVSNGVLFAEDLIFHVALVAQNGESLLKLFGDQIVRCGIVKRVLFHKMLLVKVFDLKLMIPYKLSVCLHAGCFYDANEIGPWSVLYVETVTNVANAWSDTVHLSFSSDEQRCYIDNAFMWLIKNANEKIRSLISPKVNEYLIHGVQSHLSCSDTHRRYRGLFIAETLTKWLSLGDLSFDYPEESFAYLKDLKQIVDSSAQPVDEDGWDSETLEKPLLSGAHVSDMTMCDSNVVIDSDDDEFPSYEIPNSEKDLKMVDENAEGRKRVFPPHYIKECMEDLNEQENYAKFEAAFEVLNALIRNRALAYDEVAPDLVRRLIFLSDRYNTESFQEKRLGMIVSCLVMSPQLVSVVVKIMFSRRYMILEAISKAASEISNSGEQVDEFLDVKSPKNGDSIEQKPWQQIIKERVAAKTKHFDKVKKRKLKKNLFSDVAPSFFYPLTAIEQYREHLDLLHRDCNLLAKILFVLGHILCCAENCPPTPRMARTLSECAFSLQWHKEATVRQAVLFCYCSICISLSTSVLLELFSDEVTRWFHYAVKLSETDASKTCREMAQCLSQMIATRAEAAADHML